MGGPAFEFVGDRGVILTVDGRKIKMYGDEGMTQEDVLQAAAERLSGEGKRVMVQRPGDVVIQADGMTARSEARTPKEKSDG
ncbi:MAG: hypothetical protein AB7V46_00390 [Thermomicrobiales bacterium]